MEIREVKLSSWIRILSIIFGIIAIVAGILVLADPALGVRLLIFLLSIGLLFMGIDRLVIGISGQTSSVRTHIRPGPPIEQQNRQ